MTIGTWGQVLRLIQQLFIGRALSQWTRCDFITDWQSYATRWL